MNPHDILRRLAPSDRPKNAEKIPKNRPKKFSSVRPAEKFPSGRSKFFRRSDGRRTAVRWPSDRPTAVRRFFFHFYVGFVFISMASCTEEAFEFARGLRHTSAK